MGKTELLPILMENLHTPVEPKQLHPMLLDDAHEGTIVAFDCRERLLTIQVDEMPSGKPGHRLGARAMLVFMPENAVAQTPHDQSAKDGQLQVLVRPVQRPRHPDDVLRLRNAMNDMGFDASDADIEWSYSQISDELDCGWLSLMSWDFDTTAARSVMKRLVPNASGQVAAK